MGAKGSKQLKEATLPPREIHISPSQVLDPSDPAIFPKAVRDELMAVQKDLTPTTLVLVKEFNETSAFVQWLHRSKSYFDFNDNEYDGWNGEMEEKTPRPKNTSVNRNKLPFLFKLSGMCDTLHIRTEFLANLLDVANRFLLAFLNNGHIAGFMIFTNGQENQRKCLHRYITCTGPRSLGIGKALVEELHAIAKREGYPCVTLGAADSEGFHRKMGYVRTGKASSEGPEMIYQISQKGGKRTLRKTRKNRNRTK